MNKKTVLALVAFVAGPAAIAGYVALKPDPATAREAIVHVDPNCGCCHGWMDYLRQNGFKVMELKEADMGAVKARLGVPSDLDSCHTAVIDGYVVEGHVPLEAIDRLLGEKPDVAGIASPGMPSGSPGMDGPKEPNPVYGFGNGGTRLVGTY